MQDVVEATTGLPSRRTVIGAAVWSVPVIALVTATPAFAASPPPTGFAALTPSITRLRNLKFLRKPGPISANVQLAYASAPSSNPRTVAFTWVLTVSSAAGTKTVKSGSGNVTRGGTWRQSGIIYPANWGNLTAGTYTFTFTITVAGSGSKSSSSKITI